MIADLLLAFLYLNRFIFEGFLNQNSLRDGFVIVKLSYFLLEIVVCS